MAVVVAGSFGTVRVVAVAVVVAVVVAVAVGGVDETC